MSQSDNRYMCKLNIFALFRNVLNIEIVGLRWTVHSHNFPHSDIIQIHGDNFQVSQGFGQVVFEVPDEK